jgi:hypothetical protein
MLQKYFILESLWINFSQKSVEKIVLIGKITVAAMQLNFLNFKSSSRVRTTAITLQLDSCGVSCHTIPYSLQLTKTIPVGDITNHVARELVA